MERDGTLFTLRVSVSILTRGKPRVEPQPQPFSPYWLGRFQSSLEGNPEWNALKQYESLKGGFNPHSRETPSGTPS